MRSILTSHAKVERPLCVVVIMVSFAFILFLALSFALAETTDIKVPVEEGDFVLRYLQVYEEYGFSKLTGVVQNNTNKDWKTVEFEIDAYDGKGERVTSCVVYMRNFKRNSGERFTRSIYAKVTTAARFEARFKSGEYPAAYVLSMLKPKENKSLSFEDKNIRVSFTISKRAIQFHLENQTEEPIKLDWNQVSYIDVLGESHRVMHEGVKYTDKDKHQPPTIIPPTAKASDSVFPTDHVYYSSGRYGGWNETNMFPEAPLAKQYKGKKFGVFMPMEVNGKIINYFFSFKVDDVIY